MGIARNIARLIPNGSGLLPNANIEAVAATKLTGTVPDANAPSGSVIQVVQTYIRASHTSTSSGSFVTTGLSASITPTSTSNRVLVIADLNFSTDTDTYGVFSLYRNGSEVTDARSGTATGSRSNAFIGISNRDGDSPYELTEKTKLFLDSPNSTSSQSYEIYWRKTYGGTLILGRPIIDSDSTFVIQAPYVLTLMEIAA